MQRARTSTWAALALAGALVLASCTSQDGDGSAATTTAAPAPTIPQTGARPVVDLSGTTSTAGPIDALLAVAFTADGERLLTLGKELGDRLVLRSFPWDPTRVVSAEEGRVVLAVDHPRVHAGGGLVVTPEGDAMVALGAVAFEGEPAGPQNPDGVVVRIPADRLGAEGDPFVPTRGDLVARGLRNPWRMGRDRDTGDLWVGDVGDWTAEEVNRIPADQEPGRPLNFGFPYLEGDTALVAGPPEDVELVPPTWWADRDGDTQLNSIIAGTVYRGAAIPGLQGRFVFTDFNEKAIRSFEVGGPTSGSEVSTTFTSPPTAFAEDADGELHVLTSSGDIVRLDPVGDGSGVEVEQTVVGQVWPDPRLRDTSEAIALAWEPDGTGFVAAMRRGLVTQVQLEDVQPAWCDLELATLPQVGHLSGAELEEAVRTTLEELEANEDDLPASVRAPWERSHDFYRTAWEQGEARGWDDPAVLRLLSVAAFERGEWSDVAHADQVLVNLVGETC